MISRRSFVGHVSAALAYTAVSGRSALAQSGLPLGLQLYSVREQLAKDYEGTLAKLAAMGYKEIEPASGYGGMDPKAFRAMLGKPTVANEDTALRVFTSTNVKDTGTPPAFSFHAVRRRVPVPSSPVTNSAPPETVAPGVSLNTEYTSFLPSGDHCTPSSSPV